MYTVKNWRVGYMRSIIYYIYLIISMTGFYSVFKCNFYLLVTNEYVFNGKKPLYTISYVA